MRYYHIISQKSGMRMKKEKDERVKLNPPLYLKDIGKGV